MSSERLLPAENTTRDGARGDEGIAPTYPHPPRFRNCENMRGGARAHPWQRKSLRKLEERDNIPLATGRDRSWEGQRLWRLVNDSDEEVGSVKFTRITVNPRQMGGVPCVRGLRIPVSTVVGMVADGMTEEEILAAYPDLEREDIREALRYAAEALRERELPFVTKP